MPSQLPLRPTLLCIALRRTMRDDFSGLLCSYPVVWWKHRPLKRDYVKPGAISPDIEISEDVVSVR